MYYNDYEDYMRNVLGYDNTNDNTYGCSCNYNYNYNDIYGNQYLNRNNSTSNIEQMYPEIYKIINPMVCRMCDNNMQPVSEYLIEQMTDDIYDNVVNRVEIQNVINLNIGTRDADIDLNSEMENSNNRSASNSSLASQNRNNATSNVGISKSLNNTMSENSKEIEMKKETRSIQPRRRNSLLRDLIRILILNRLIRPGRPNNRPPFRPGPIGPRPGMQGPGYRPPMPF